MKKLNQVLKRTALSITIIVSSLVLFNCSSTQEVQKVYSDTNMEVDKLRLTYDKKNTVSQVGVTVSDDGETMAIAYDDKKINILDLRQGEIVKSLDGDFRDLFEIRFSSDAEKLISIDKNGLIIVHDLKTDENLQQEISDEITKVETGPNNYLAVGTKSTSLYLFDLTNGLKIKKKFDLKGALVSAIAFGKNGDLVVMNNGAGIGFRSNGKAYLLNTETLTSIPQDFNIPTVIYGIRYYPEEEIYSAGMLKFKGKPFVGFYHLSVTKGELRISSKESMPGYFRSRNEDNTRVNFTNFFHSDDNLLVANFDNSFFGYDIRNKEFAFSTLSNRNMKLVKETAVWNLPVQPRKIYPLYDGKSFLVNYDEENPNVNQIFNSEKLKFTSFIYTDGADEMAFVARDGRMEGSAEAISNVYWSQRETDKRVPLEATFDQFYTPNLLQTLLSGDDSDTQNIASLEKAVELSPLVEITRPDSVFNTDKDQLKLTVKATPQGDPIEKFKVFVNGKPISGEQRGLKMSGNSKTFTVPLLPGRSVISAVAVSEGGYQSAPDRVIANYQGRTAEANLHVLAVGIDKYYNQSYNLNYATADAFAFTEKIRQKADGIFGDINVIFIKDKQATKDQIQEAVNEIQARAQLQDVFIFYYAGHGVMSEGTDAIPSDFYLALHDVTQLYGQDQMLKDKGISAAELRDIFSGIQAQKQLIVLDACQSGGAVETFAMRGAAEEKAMIQLARSSGVVLLASTGTEQFATEFDELGHGVFTYSILQGLGGQADSGDNKVTVKELEAHLNDSVPELTEKYKGTVQFPRSWSRGMDFPIGVIK